MIVLENISREFKKEKVLKNISISIETSNITSIIAPNGVGKTTLLCVISNIIFPTSGNVIFKNNFTQYDIFLILSGDRNLYLKNTVYENIRYFCTLRGLKKREIDENIAKYEKKMPLYSKIKSKLCEELSFGQKRLVMIFIAFVAEARCIVMDEPSEGLDQTHVEILENILMEHKKDKIILLTSHNYEFLSKVSDKSIFLKSGEVASEIGQANQKEILDIYRKLYREVGNE